MIKTHELDVTASKFSQLLETNYMILKTIKLRAERLYFNLEKSKLSKKKSNYTSKSQLTQIKQIINDEGIKEGYVLAVLNKI